MIYDTLYLNEFIHPIINIRKFYNGSGNRIPVKEETSDLKKQLSELEETNDDDDWATSLQNLEKIMIFFIQNK